MYLDAVSEIADGAVVLATGSVPACRVFDKWAEWPASAIDHHGERCCETAREWLSAIDYSFLNGGRITAGPRWLRQRFGWGPGSYPIHWCEVLEKKTLDCGVHAALADEVFTQRGLRSFRAQLVQEFSEDASHHWRLGWENDGAVTAWINGETIYHEGAAVLTSPGEVKLWDSSAGWWVDPKTTSGYGSLRALRIATHVDMDLKFGQHLIRTNIWNDLGI
jgi:hypothetical protein